MAYFADVVSRYPILSRVVSINPVASKSRIEIYPPFEPFVFSVKGQVSNFEDWTHKSLSDRFGSSVISVSVGPRLESHKVSMSLKDAISGFGSKLNDQLYARQIPVPGPIDVQLSNVFIERLLPADREKIINLWIGPTDTVQPFHKDNHNPLALIDGFLVQLFGSKEVLMVPHECDEWMYPRNSEVDYHYSEIDLLNFDCCRHSGFFKSKIKCCEISAGEAVYIPANTWHHVRSLSDSTSLSYWWHRDKVADRIYRAALIERDKFASVPISKLCVSDIRSFGMLRTVLALKTLSCKGVMVFLNYCNDRVRNELSAHLAH